MLHVDYITSFVSWQGTASRARSVSLGMIALDVVDLNLHAQAIRTINYQGLHRLVANALFLTAYE